MAFTYNGKTYYTRDEVGQVDFWGTDDPAIWRVTLEDGSKLSGLDANSAPITAPIHPVYITLDRLAASPATIGDIAAGLDLAGGNRTDVIVRSLPGKILWPSSPVPGLIYQHPSGHIYTWVAATGPNGEATGYWDALEERSMVLGRLGTTSKGELNHGEQDWACITPQALDEAAYIRDGPGSGLQEIIDHDALQTGNNLVMNPQFQLWRATKWWPNTNFSGCNEPECKLAYFGDVPEQAIRVASGWRVFGRKRSSTTTYSTAGVFGYKRGLRALYGLPPAADDIAATWSVSGTTRFDPDGMAFMAQMIPDLDLFTGQKVKVRIQLQGSSSDLARLTIPLWVGGQMYLGDADRTLEIINAVRIDVPNSNVTGTGPVWREVELEIPPLGGRVLSENHGFDLELWSSWAPKFDPYFGEPAPETLDFPSGLAYNLFDIEVTRPRVHARPRTLEQEKRIIDDVEFTDTNPTIYFMSGPNGAGGSLEYKAPKMARPQRMLGLSSSDNFDETGIHGEVHVEISKSVFARGTYNILGGAVTVDGKNTGWFASGFGSQLVRLVPGQGFQPVYDLHNKLGIVNTVEQFQQGAMVPIQVDMSALVDATFDYNTPPGPVT